MDERISEAIDGNQDALGELLFEHYDRLARFIRRKMPAALRSQLDTDDILQQAFVGAFRDIASFRPKSDRAFGQWLQTIAEHRLVDAIRACRSQKRGGKHRRVSADQDRTSIFRLWETIAADTATASRKVRRDEAIQALQVHLAALADDQREVIQLFYIDGHSRDEVARRLGRFAGRRPRAIAAGKKKTARRVGPVFALSK